MIAGIRAVVQAIYSNGEVLFVKYTLPQNCENEAKGRAAPRGDGARGQIRNVRIEPKFGHVPWGGNGGTEVQNRFGMKELPRNCENEPSWGDRDIHETNPCPVLDGRQAWRMRHFFGSGACDSLRRIHRIDAMPAADRYAGAGRKADSAKNECSFPIPGGR